MIKLQVNVPSKQAEKYQVTFIVDQLQQQKKSSGESTSLPFQDISVYTAGKKFKTNWLFTLNNL